MNGIVKSVNNFYEGVEWLFIIEDENKGEYFVMPKSFYKENKLKSPVTKRELDYLIEKMQICFEYKVIEEKNVITKIEW